MSPDISICVLLDLTFLDLIQPDLSSANTSKRSAEGAKDHAFYLLTLDLFLVWSNKRPTPQIDDLTTLQTDLDLQPSNTLIAQLVGDIGWCYWLAN